MQPGIPPETAMKVYRRYLKIEPTHVEEYIAYLKAKVSCVISLMATRPRCALLFACMSKLEFIYC